jgi:hypothetical protein
MVAPIVAAAGAAAKTGATTATGAAATGAAAKLGTTGAGYASSFMPTNFGSIDNSGALYTLLLKQTKTSEKQKDILQQNLTKLATLVGVTTIATHRTPFKALLSLISSIVTVFLTPIGMIFLTLFKPFLVWGLKTVVEWMSWMNQNKA